MGRSPNEARNEVVGYAVSGLGTKRLQQPFSGLVTMMMTGKIGMVPIQYGNIIDNLRYMSLQNMFLSTTSLHLV